MLNYKSPYLYLSDVVIKPEYRIDLPKYNPTAHESKQ